MLICHHVTDEHAAQKGFVYTIIPNCLRRHGENILVGQDVFGKLANC